MLRRPQQRGQIQNWLPHPCVLGGPQVGRIATLLMHSQVSPTKGTKSELAISYPRLLGDPQVGGIATPPVHCRWSPTKGTKSELATSPLPSWGPASGHNCYVTPALPVVPNKGNKIRIGTITSAFSGAHKWAELIRYPCILGRPQQRGRIQNWLSHTLAFSGTHKWAELLRHLCIVGGPQQRGQNKNWLPHPCLLGDPQVGTIATLPLHSRTSPTRGIK